MNSCFMIQNKHRRLILSFGIAVIYALYTGFVLLHQMPLRSVMLIKIMSLFMIDEQNIDSYILVAICINFCLGFIVSYHFVYLLRALKWYFRYLSLKVALISIITGGVFYSLLPWIFSLFFKSDIWTFIIYAPISMLFGVWNSFTLHRCFSGDKHINIMPLVFTFNFVLGGGLGYGTGILVVLLKKISSSSKR